MFVYIYIYIYIEREFGNIYFCIYVVYLCIRELFVCVCVYVCSLFVFYNFLKVNMNCFGVKNYFNVYYFLNFS